MGGSVGSGVGLMRRRWAGLDRVAFTGGGQVFGMGKVSIASRGTWPSAAVFLERRGMRR